MTRLTGYFLAEAESKSTEKRPSFLSFPASAQAPGTVCPDLPVRRRERGLPCQSSQTIPAPTCPERCRSEPPHNLPRFHASAGLRPAARVSPHKARRRMGRHGPATPTHSRRAATVLSRQNSPALPRLTVGSKPIATRVFLSLPVERARGMEMVLPSLPKRIFSAGSSPTARSM